MKRLALLHLTLAIAPAPAQPKDWGKRIVEYRAEATVAAIREAMK